jgi:hypothetical protein
MQIWRVDGSIVVGSGADLAFELQARGSEIEQETMLEPRGRKIADKLDGMSDRQSFHRLQFHNELAFDYKIGLKRADFFTIVKNGQYGVNFKRNASLPKLDNEGLSIERFDEPTPKRPVDFHGQPNDAPIPHHIRRHSLIRKPFHNSVNF